MIFLESLFGPCDPRFEFGTIRLSTDECDVPQTHFPEGLHTHGDCVVDIQISSVPWESRIIGQGLWQVAHECVHLLDPDKRGTTVLEEGLCAWFQDESKYHSADVKAYISRNKSKERNYVEARDKVRSCMTNQGLIPVIKEIRASGVRIRDIRVEHLTPYLSSHLVDVNPRDLELLCERFE